MSQIIQLTPDRQARLKTAIRRAQEAEQEVFEFEGRQFMVDYDKYLVQYFETNPPKAHSPTRQNR